MLAVTSVPLTGLVLPGSFVLFDALALLAAGLNFRTLWSSPIQLRAWLFAGVVAISLAAHHTQPDVPASSGLIFARGLMTCLLVSALVTAAGSLSVGFERTATWLVHGSAVTALYAVVAEALPILYDIPGIAGDIGMSGRSLGLSRHSNLLGLHVAVAGVYLYGLPVRRSHKSTLWICLLAGLVISGSRAGVVYLIVGLGAIAVLSRPGRERHQAVRVVLALLAVASAAMMATEPGRLLYDRMTGARGVTGDDERRELVALGIELAGDHWLLGAPYDGRLFHNIYLSYLAVVGLAGLLALVALLGRSAWLVGRCRPSRVRTTALASIGSLIVVLLAHNAVTEPVIWFVILAPSLVADRTKRRHLPPSQDSGLGQ